MANNTALTFVDDSSGTLLIGEIRLQGDILTKKEQNFDMVAGDSKDLVVILSNSGAPVDLSGLSVTWSLKGVTKPLNPLTGGQTAGDIHKDMSQGIVIKDAAKGVFVVQLRRDDTLYCEGIYNHEAKLIDSAGNTSTVSMGRVIMMPN
jgi:hypothetical protein